MEYGKTYATITLKEVMNGVTGCHCPQGPHDSLYATVNSGYMDSKQKCMCNDPIKLLNDVVNHFRTIEIRMTEIQEELDSGRDLVRKVQGSILAGDCCSKEE